MPIEVNENGELIAPQDHIGLRSEAMSEIISKKPGFLSKWALLIFVVVLILLVSTTWFIHYPDVVKTRATLMATNAPKEIIARQEGHIIRLFVNNGESVTSGSIIAFIESTANHEQVLKLFKLLDSTINDLENDNTQFIFTRFEANHDQLGELQQGYQQFMTIYQQFKDYLQNGFYFRKKMVLREDLEYLIMNQTILQEQKQLIVKDLKLSEETYKANEQLLRDKVISKLDDRNEQSKLLNKQISIPQIDATILNNKTQQREKIKEISELEHSISIQKGIFRQSVQTLISLVDDWINKFVIKAPITGKLVLMMPLQENEYVKAGKSFGFVAPNNSQYYVEVTIPQYNFGKTDTNQTVQLRFDAYPYQEFGYVIGKIKYISDIPTDSGYIAHIHLPEGLVTNLKKKIQYREGLKAESLIITKERKLTQRFFDNLFSSLKR